MPTTTLPSARLCRFQIQNCSLDLAWSHCALCLHHFRSSSRHRLPHVPRLPSAGHRRPPSPYPAYALRHVRSPGRPYPVLVALSPASPEDSIASSAASTSSPSLSAPSPGSPSPPAVRACREPPCRPPPGSSAPPPPSLPRVTARSSSHRQWMARSYAVTLPSSPAACSISGPIYWSHLGDTFAAVGVIAFTLASLLLVDLGLNWRELTTRRA